MQTKRKHLLIAAAPPKAELDSKLVGETVTVTAGSDLVLDGSVGGKPEPTVYWSKGDKVLELGEKYSLTYTATRAMAVIKSCDRYDTGRYILTVKNASGIKTASVNVKVLGEQTLLSFNIWQIQIYEVGSLQLSHLTMGCSLSDTPGPPADKIVISRVTEEKCTVSWKIPLEDGGDTVTHYIVERRETSRLNWVMMETECKTLSCVSSRLIKNNEYIFRVRGVNKFGPGVPLESEPVIARNAYSEPQLAIFEEFFFQTKRLEILIYKFISPIYCHHVLYGLRGRPEKSQISLFSQQSHPSQALLRPQLWARSMSSLNG